MPDPKIFEETQAALEELEDKIGEDYPEVASILGEAQAQLEQEHEGMGMSEDLPPDLEGEDIPMEEGAEEGAGGPLSGLPPGLEDEEEEDEEEEIIE